jgi:Bacterial PH domain
MGIRGSELPSTTRYELHPHPPLATLGAAAATTVVGCGLLVIYAVRSSGAAPLVVGVALLIIGITLAVGAVLFVTRFRSVIELDAESITIRRGSRQRRLQWSEIKHVSLQGPRLTLRTKSPTEDAVVINPRTPADPTFMLLLAALNERLDASRGYGGTR